MTLREKLNERFSKADWMDFMHNQPNAFTEGIELALSDEAPEGWRAAWLLHHVMEINDSRFQPKLDALLDVLPDKQEGHQRELLKILLKMELSDDQLGRLFDLAMTIWETVSKKPGLRIIAFKILLKISKHYPELQTELLAFTTEDYTNTLSPGIQNSFNKLKKQHLKVEE